MKQLKEQFYWPLGLAILLLILEVFVPEQKRGRRPGAPPTGAGAVAALLLFLALCPSANASAAKAQSHYRAGEYKSALAEYQHLLNANPNDPRLHYNAGASAYQASKYDEAIKQFQAAAGSPDLDLQRQSFYNLGNAEFRLGQGDPNTQQRTAVWEQALQHYDAALKLNPQDKDALFNRDLVKEKLEELKKEQSKSQQENKNNENKDSKDKDQQNKDQKNNESEQKQSEQEKNQQQNQPGEQSKQDQQKQQQEQKNQQSPESDQQKEQGQQKEGEQKQDQANQQQGGQKNSDQQKPEGEGNAAQYAELGKMTPAQAKQLLDAQKGEEKALLFIPQEAKSSSRNRIFKDW